MSNHPNHRRGHGHIQDHGPGYESRTPAAGCNSTHVARSRTKWKRRYNRKERRTGEVQCSGPAASTRTRPQIETEDPMAEDETKTDALETPDWIRDHIEAHGNRGWFFPIRVVTGHPVVDTPCFDCGEQILVGDVVFVMPFHAEDGSKWICQHKMCTARQMFGEDAEAMLALGREHRRKSLSGDSD